MRATLALTLLLSCLTGILSVREKVLSIILKILKFMKIFLNSKKTWMPRCPRQWWKVA